MSKDVKVVKMLDEMKVNGFGDWGMLEDSEVEKKYKCYLSKKCNDEKFERIKKMFEFCKDNEDFIKFMGKNDYEKLNESYGKKDGRGVVVKKDYNGLDVLEVFMNEKIGVKEVCKKGYVVEMSVESKGMGVYKKVSK